MAVPINEQDYQRFLKLAEALNKHKFTRSRKSNEKDEINLYLSQSSEGVTYVHLEMVGYLPNQVAEEIFSDTQVKPS